ncbi:MAG: NADH-quinone oxidoreductase subunit J [Halobacteriales archaeon]
MTSTYELLAFGLFAAITVGSGIGVVLVRDVWHAALLLGVALVSVAVHFIMLRAEFLAAMQILVYVGGVLILISFAIMLTRRPDADTTEATADGDTDPDPEPDPEGVST